MHFGSIAAAGTWHTLASVKKAPPSLKKGPFSATLARIAGKGGWTYVLVPKNLAPPVTRAWNRTPIRAIVDGVEWDTSVWRARTGEGFLPVPKRIRGEKGEGDKVRVSFTYVDD